MSNLKTVKFLRNGSLFQTREAALAVLSGKTNVGDGVAVLARYGSGDNVKTLVGFNYAGEGGSAVTIFDVDGVADNIQALRTEINNKLGNGVTTENTATKQFAALVGTTGDTSSASSIVGAKKYADEKIGEAIDGLDYSGVTTGDGVYVTNVTEADGKIAATTATLPTVADEASAKTFVTSVSEDKGQISVSKGSITSSNKTIVLTDNADGGVDFKANVDGTTIIVNDNTGVMSVASSALVQYEGDGDTIQIGAVSDGKRIVSSPLTIQKVTTGIGEEVKEEYHLVGASGNTIGDPVKIYKDSHIVSINYITTGEHAQNLEYVYIDASGNTQTTYVDMSELVLESEFASGVTITDHVAHGVVDPQSENFLTVGADGFKLSGVQDAIDAAVDTAVSGLDATVNDETEHITIEINEVDGVLTSVDIAESDIASASALTAEIGAREAADTALDNRLGTGVTSVKTATAQFAALVGTDADTSGSTSIAGAKKYTDAKIAEANADVEDLSGKTLALSAKTVTEIVGDNAVSALSAATDDGTVKYTLATQLSTAAATAADDAYVSSSGDNVLQIKNDGLFLSDTWDCGTYDTNS